MAHNYLITCEQCGKEAWADRLSRRYCTVKCRVAAYKARQGYRYKLMRAEAYRRAKRRKTRQCAWCGADFVPHHHAQLYCKALCKYAKHNSARGAA